MAAKKGPLDRWAYQYGPVHPNTQDYATYYCKPWTHGCTGSGYMLWRSTEWRDHTPRQAKEDVYVAEHRLLAVVACYDSDTPIEEVLADLDGKDVHHKSGMPADNRPDNLAVIDHGRHSTITQADRRAWAADAKREVEQETFDDAERCPGCGQEIDVECTSPGFSGVRCVSCAKGECDGEPIEVGD